MTTADFNTCVDLHADSVYRFILKNLRDEDTSQDIVQESFAKMWERVDEIDAQKAKSYLFTTAYHTMINEVRKGKFSTPMADMHENLQTTRNAYNDVSSVLQEALGKLPEVQRSVIMLRDYEGYSYEEIGDITGLGESQVKVYIYRARMALKKYLVSIDLVI